MASLLALLALVTLVVKSVVEWRGRAAVRPPRAESRLALVLGGPQAGVGLAGADAVEGVR